jgi:uncharacterized glyoxalase superfamily protein PhnB
VPQSTSVSVMLIVPEASAAVAWYKNALGATELWNLGGVAGLEIDGAPVFLHEANPNNPSENSPDPLGATSTQIELFVDDPDASIERAIAAGASRGSEIKITRCLGKSIAKAAFVIHSDTTGPSVTGLHSAVTPVSDGTPGSVPQRPSTRARVRPATRRYRGTSQRSAPSGRPQTVFGEEATLTGLRRAPPSSGLQRAVREAARRSKGPGALLRFDRDGILRVW